MHLYQLLRNCVNTSFLNIEMQGKAYILLTDSLDHPASTYLLPVNASLLESLYLLLSQ
jgi:hypothetical protein